MNNNEAEESVAAITASEYSGSSRQSDSSSAMGGSEQGSSDYGDTTGSSDCRASSETGSSGSDNTYFGSTLQESGNEKDGDSQKRKQARKMRRVMANRRSARESRERRKTLLKDMQDAVNRLSEENKEIAQANLAMRQELVHLLIQSGLAPTTLSL